MTIIDINSASTQKSICCPTQNSEPPATGVMQKVSSIWERFTQSKLIQNCAIRNPLKTIFASGNNYVETMWSNDYFIGCKENLEIAKENLENAVLELKNRNGKNSGQKLLHAVSALMVLGLNVELGNFLKGCLGVLISTGKLVIHGVEFTFDLIAAILITVIIFPTTFFNTENATIIIDSWKGVLNSLQNIAKDLANIITCVGHAIPSWLPLALIMIPGLQPAAIPLLLIKKAAQFTGIFDLLGYGGTAILLKIQQLNASENEKAALDEKWKTLKDTLNPFKSYEGAVIGAFGVHVAATAAATLGSFALSHVGIDVKATTLRDGAYAVTGAALAVFGYGAYKHKHNQSQETLPWFQTDEKCLQA